MYIRRQCIHTYARTHAHTHTHARTHAHTYIYIYTCIFMCVCVRVCVCVCVCIHQETIQERKAGWESFLAGATKACASPQEAELLEYVNPET